MTTRRLERAASLFREVQAPGSDTKQEVNMAPKDDHKSQHHTEKITARLQEIVTHLREDIKRVDDPQLKAMFETSAEVLGGLMKAFGDYDKKNEAAWRKSA